MKKIIFTVAAATIALSFANVAYAAPTITLSAPLSSPTITVRPISADGSLSGIFGHSGLIAGAFSDTFHFTIPKFSTAGESIVSVFSTNPQNDLNFTSVTFDGTPLIIGSTGTFEYRFLNDLPVAAGLQTLIVNGTSGGNSSYAGSFSITPAVPEPSTWAMLLVGLGGIGFIMRRRQSARVTYA